MGDGFLPVLHLKLYNPTDDYYGFPPLAAAQGSVDIHNASSAWNKALLDNAARPSGALTYANPATGDRMAAEQFDRLKAELEDAHMGAAAAFWCQTVVPLGERGPEVFRPAGSGDIAPLTSGGMSINLTVQGAADPTSFVRSQAQVAQALARAVALGGR